MTKFHAVENMKSRFRVSFCNNSRTSAICNVDDFLSLSPEVQCKRCLSKISKQRLKLTKER